MKTQDVWNLFPEREAFARLTTDQRDAVLELLLLTSVIDDVVTGEELDTMVEEMTMLPFFDQETVGKIRSEEAFTRRSEITDAASSQKAVDKMLKSIRKRLHEETLRKGALLLASMLIARDGMEDREVGFAHRLGRALHLEPSETDLLLRVAHEYVQPKVEGPEN